MITNVSITGYMGNNVNINNNINKRKNVTFYGLTDRMGKKIYNGFYEMSELFPKEEMKNPIAGKLPLFMKNKIAATGADVEVGTKEIFDTFAQVSNELRDFEPNVNTTMSELKNKRNDSTVKKLENVLMKYNIVKPYDEFNIRYIDKGGKGSVYKLEGLRDIHGQDDDEFVIKVFHTKSVQANTYHGCFPEINAATYWMKNLGYNTNRGKFFWGDVKEAYMVNKFIDEDVRLPRKFPNAYDNGVKFTDEDLVHIHNVCKEYSYDWGGGVVINQVVNSNKYAKKIMNEIKNQEERYRIVDWYKYHYTKAKGNYDCKNAGLALAIKYIKPEDRTKCFEQCFSKRGKYTDRALAYTLKYLPHEEAVSYYEVLARSNNDKVLKKILSNEIPLLSVKDEYKPKIKDDLIVMDKVSHTYLDKYFDKDRAKEYIDIAKKNKLL